MPQNSFDNLKGYARYLLDNKMNDLILFSIIYAKEEKLGFIKDRSDKEMRFFLEASLTKFLTDIIEDNPIESQLQSLNNWIQSEKSEFPPQNVRHIEISIAYKIRKKVLLAYVEEYTPNLSYQKEIRDEMNILIHIIEKMAIQML
jgi:hypothetical protein